MASERKPVRVPFWLEVALAVVVAFAVFMFGAGLLELILEHK